MDLLLMNVYRPPGCKTELFVQTIETLRNILKNSEEYTKSAANVLIFGDFNFPEMIWKHGSGYLKTENRTVPEGQQRK